MLLFWNPVISTKQVLFSIDTTIYKFVGDIYDFLINLAQVQFFRTEQINAFYTRLYVLIGIIMLFRIVFILMGIVVNPAKAFHEKEGTAIPMASRVVTTIVLILIIPFIFSLAYRFQSVILEEGVIGRLITGVAGTTPIGGEVFIKAERCTYQKIADASTGLFWIRSPFVYDLGLAPSANEIEVMNAAGNPSTAYLGNVKQLGEFSQNNYKTATFTSVDGIKVVDGVRVCSPYAYVYVTEVPFLINEESGMRAVASIDFANKVDRGWFSEDSNFELIDSEPSTEGSYKLTAGRSFGAQLLSNFIISDPNDHADFYDAVSDADFENMEIIINDSFERVDSETRYYLLLSTLAGLAIMLLLVSSCFDIALRAVKLGFLQLTAPIPIASYMEGGRQGGSTFNRWVKVVTGTYADIFIRVAALSFVTYILNLITQEGLLIEMVTNPEGEAIYHQELVRSSGWLLQLFIIFGLFMFIKIAPKMIGDIFNLNLGDAGNFLEFNPLKKLQSTPVVGTITAGAAGAFSGYAMGAATGGLGGAFRGTFTGALAGARRVSFGGREFDKKQGFFEGVRETFTPFTYGARRAAAGSRVASAREVVRNLDNATTTLGSRYNNAEIDSSNARVNLDWANRSAATARTRVETVEPLHSRAATNYRASQERFNKAESNYSDINSRYNEVRGRFGDANENYRNLNREHSDLSSRIEEARNNPNVSKEEIVDLNHELGVLEGKRTRVAQERQQLGEETVDLRRELRAAKEEVDKSHAERERKEDELIDASYENAIREDEERDALQELRENEELFGETESERIRLEEERRAKLEELERARSKLEDAERTRRDIE